MGSPRESPRTPVALTIAGSDSGGGAGIVADLKTFTAHGVWGTCAVTAVTAQNTVGVQEFAVLDPEMVVSQIESVAGDIGVDSAKTGMLASAAIVDAVAAAIVAAAIAAVVVDPVFVSKHGDTLLADDAVSALRTRLLPLATIVTPNLAEAAALAGIDRIDDVDAMRRAAEKIGGLGPSAVLVKGGHLAGSPTDLLWNRGDIEVFEGSRIPGRHTHGTGCVLSAAITARLARGDALVAAVEGARRYVRAGIKSGLPIGRGVGPVNPPARG